MLHDESVRFLTEALVYETKETDHKRDNSYEDIHISSTDLHIHAVAIGGTLPPPFELQFHVHVYAHHNTCANALHASTSHAHNSHSANLGSFGSALAVDFNICSTCAGDKSVGEAEISNAAILATKGDAIEVHEALQYHAPGMVEVIFVHGAIISSPSP